MKRTLVILAIFILILSLLGLSFISKKDRQGKTLEDRVVFGETPSLENIDACVSSWSKSQPESVYRDDQYVIEGKIEWVRGTTILFRAGEKYDLSDVPIINLTQLRDGNIEERTTVTLAYDIGQLLDILDPGDNVSLQRKDGKIISLHINCNAK